MPPKKKGKAKAKKDEGAVTGFGGLVRKVKTLVQRELETKSVDKHPLVARFDMWGEREGAKPVNLVFNFPMEPIMVRVICTALIEIKWEKIKSLIFTNTEVGDVGAEHVARALPFLPFINKVEFSDCGLGPAGCRHLGRALIDPRVKLKILKLDFNPITSDGLQYLAEGIAHNQTLTKLTISYCRIDRTGGPLINMMLGQNRANGGMIRELDMEGNDLRNDGLTAISPGVGECSTLKVLNIAQNKLVIRNEDDFPVIEALAQGFAQNVELKEINLDGNLIGGIGCELLLDLLQDCTHIKKMRVSHIMSKEIFRRMNEWLASHNVKKSKGKKKKGKKKKK